MLDKPVERSLVDASFDVTDLPHTLEPSRTDTHDASVSSTGIERPGMLVAGRYKLLETIGEGGMGTVWVAEQLEPVRRTVAIKLVKSGMDSRQVISRFEAERQALAVMDHPSIATVLDGGVTEHGRPYFVMEYVKGVAITEYCDANRLMPRERLELFVVVCQAIQHAHQKGIIHRDIKPSNVMIACCDGKPIPKVIDFGVAKAIEQNRVDQALLTQFGTLVGTLEYMSPEQAEMSDLGIDTRSDIYALGVLLYELLTGSTPLTHKRLKEVAYSEILRMIKEDEPPRPSTRLSDSGEALASISAQRHMDSAKLTKLVRGELDWIVMKCLEKDRNRRYETARDFAADVQRFLNDEPVQACPPSAMYRLRKLVRRNKGPVLAASIVVLALLVGVIGTTRGMVRARAAEAEAVLEAEQKETALSAARRSERDAKDQLFLALLNQARSGRLSRRMGQRLDSLATLEKAARIRPDDRLRDEAMAALALPDIRRGASIHAKPTAVSFDGLYESYAQWDDQGAVSIRGIPDNAEIQCIKTRSKVSSVQLSPNGQFLAVWDDRKAVQLWHVAEGKALFRTPEPCRYAAFSPDSRQMAVAKDDWILAIDVVSGKETHRWHLPAESHALAFQPNNCHLAVSYSNSEVVSIYDYARGSHVSDLPVGLIDFPVVAWHPDGVRLAVGGSNPSIQIWDTEMLLKLGILQGHVQQVTMLSFHPDGSLLASGSWDGTLRLWDSATGRPLMQLPLSAVVQFSSTGKLGYQWQSGEEMQLLEVTSGREYRTIVSSLGAGLGSYQDGDISPDGRLLALALDDTGDGLWDLASGRELALLPSKSHCVLFQSDGRALLTFDARGLHRWPIQDSLEADNELRLGPPGKIALPFVSHRASPSRDGQQLAIVSETSGAGLLLDLATESVSSQRFEHAGASQIALSRDGRWIASCGWHSDRVRLWNAKTAIMVHEWVLGKETSVYFTPDSRALIICRGDAFTFWDVETLQPIRRLAREVALYPGHVAFSSDGTLMALEMAPAVIHLREVATGRLVAKLEDPHGDRAQWMGFTPDGTQLVVAAPYAKEIHIWDLRAMRQRLKVMGLDWDWPEFPSADLKVLAAAPMKVNVLPGDLARPLRTREQKATQAIAQYRLEVKREPDNASACNELAWICLTAPAALRDVEAALPLAENAVRLANGNATYRNTLGLAYYRAGRYREAVDMLRPNLDKQDDTGLAFDLYILTMSHHRLGETARAQDYLAWADRWTRTQRELPASYIEELKEFRAEAEELLEIKKGP